MPDSIHESAARAACAASSHRRGALLLAVGASATILLVVLTDFGHQARFFEVIAKVIVSKVPLGLSMEMAPAPGIYGVFEPMHFNSMGIIAEIGLLALGFIPVLLVVLASWHIVGLTTVILLYRQWGRPSYQSAFGSTWVTDGTGLLVLGQTAVAAAIWLPLAYALRFVWYEALHAQNDAGLDALYIRDGSIAASWAGAMLLTMIAASRAWRGAVLARLQPEQIRCGICDYTVGTNRGRCPECGTMDSGVVRFSLFRTRAVQRVATGMVVAVAISLYAAPLTVALGLRAYWTVWLALKGGSMVP